MVFRGLSDSTGKGILNGLEAVNLSGIYVEEESIAVI